MRTEKFSIIMFDEEKISFDNILKHLGGLSDLDIDIFKHLLTIESPYGTCINRMVKTLNKDRSQIQRCLSKLMEMDIVIRERIRRTDYIKICEELNISYKAGKNEKGSLYLYKAVSNSVLKQVLSNASRKWFEVIQTSIQDL